MCVCVVQVEYVCVALVRLVQCDHSQVLLNCSMLYTGCWLLCVEGSGTYIRTHVRTCVDFYPLFTYFLWLCSIQSECSECPVQ